MAFKRHFLRGEDESILIGLEPALGLALLGIRPPGQSALTSLLQSLYFVGLDDGDGSPVCAKAGMAAWAVKLPTNKATATKPMAILWVVIRLFLQMFLTIRLRGRVARESPARETEGREAHSGRRSYEYYT